MASKPGLISVEAAAAIVRAAAPAMQARNRLLVKVHGRVLAQDVVASRAQPPFVSSAMDGYAVAALAGELKVVGESRAGKGFASPVKPGEAVRIFTGAPVPEGAGCVIIQENVKRDGDTISVLADGLASTRTHIRPVGLDFQAGDVLLRAGHRLDAWSMSLIAASGLGEVSVARRPRVCVLATGDELVPPGQKPKPDQIWESASYAVMARAQDWGARAAYLGAADDTDKAVVRALASVQADLIVTIGGASVGDHDRVKPALEQLGLIIDFAGVNVRPGKPTWFGRLGDGRRVLGLPGNPASALVCAELFLRPFVFAMLGQGASPDSPALPLQRAVLTRDVPAFDPREGWLRASLETGEDGVQRVTPAPKQDSSLLQTFAQSGGLLRVPSGGGGLQAGQVVEVLRF